MSRHLLFAHIAYINAMLYTMLFGCKQSTQQNVDLRNRERMRNWNTFSEFSLNNFCTLCMCDVLLGFVLFCYFFFRSQFYICFLLFFIHLFFLYISNRVKCVFSIFLFFFFIVVGSFWYYCELKSSVCTHGRTDFSLFCVRTDDVSVFVHYYITHSLLYMILMILFVSISLFTVCNGVIATASNALVKVQNVHFSF